MYELYPYFTNDGSVGLFSPEADDIYHSTYGALTEAYEKFILPSNLKNFLKKNTEIKVLDICFGIGYNTKSFLNFIYNDKIGSNNITYTNKIDTYNKKTKIYIHAIDTDKNLAYLSPFFVTGKKNIKNNKLTFKQEKIQRMLSDKTSPRFELKKEIQILLLQKLCKDIDQQTESLLFAPKNSQYFDRYMKALYRFYKNDWYNLSSLRHLSSFLHNIYYRHLSTCHKNALKALNLLDFDFKLSIEDARQAVKNDENKYNYVFLDAFTPTKCPCLWTVDFFKLLYEHLEAEGMILTYSNSALVRNAFLHAGFKVGKIYSESAQKFTGTVAIKCPLPLGEGRILNEPASCKNSGEGAMNIIAPVNIDKNFISPCEGYITELSEYDLGLMKTKAGIFYRDENLTLSNEEITNAHKIEVENSKLISSSKFIKSYKQKNKVIGM